MVTPSQCHFFLLFTLIFIALRQIYHFSHQFLTGFPSKNNPVYTFSLATCMHTQTWIHTHKHLLINTITHAHDLTGRRGKGREERREDWGESKDGRKEGIKEGSARREGGREWRKKKKGKIKKE